VGVKKQKNNQSSGNKAGYYIIGLSGQNTITEDLVFVS